MHPVLFEIFGFPLRTYGMAMATAFIVNIFLVYRRCPVEHQDRQVVLNACLWIVVGTLVGGRLLFAYTQWDDFVSDPKKLIAFWEGGLVFYGGFIGSYVAALAYLLWENLKLVDRKKMIGMLVALTFFFGYIVSGINIALSEKLTTTIGQFIGFWNWGLHHTIGFLLSFVFVFTYWSVKTRKEERPYRLLPIMDLLSPYVGLGLAIHRTFGCFLNGCCYGRPTDLPWGVQFPLSHAGTRFYGVAAHLHPSQIYEAFNGLIIFFALLWFRKRKKADGEVTAMLLMIYAVNRYFIEFLRGDSLRGEVGHAISVSTFVFGFFVFAAACFAVLTLSRQIGIKKGIVETGSGAKAYGGFALLMAGLFIYAYLCELLRLEPTLATVGPLSTSQFIGYLTFFAGFAIYVTSHYFGRRAIPVTLTK